MLKNLIWAVLCVGLLALCWMLAQSHLGAKAAKPAPAQPDCSRRSNACDAGFSWAQTHFVTDESDCEFAGETSEFTAGCRKYVRGYRVPKETGAPSLPSNYDEPDDN